MQNYSEFCQSQANANQAAWGATLEQYRLDVERERQRQEQQRLAQERQRKQQLQRQQNLKLLEQWHSAAIALGKSADYVERIESDRYNISFCSTEKPQIQHKANKSDTKPTNC